MSADHDDRGDGRSDDFERGLARRRAMLGDDWVDRATAGATAFNAEFQELITRYAWHEIWNRPGLDAQTRRLLVLGMTMGQARWEEFELHCRAALRGGVSPDAIKETLLQGAIYCGVPAANTAFKIAGRLLEAEGLAPGPAPLTPAARARRHFTFSAPQLHVVLEGEGGAGDARALPVVLAHPLGLDLHLWDGLAASLAASGHPVLRYDQRGHGRSARPPGAWSLSDLVDDAARVIREWGRGPVAFVGLSLGGMVGQGLALEHPELVAKLVLAHTSAAYPPEARRAFAERIAAVRAGGMAAVVEAVVGRYLNAAFRAREPAVAAALRDKLLAQDPAAYATACTAAASVDYLDRLTAIRAPTLVLAGALDVGAPPALARAIAGRIPGSSLEVIAEASHLSVVETPQLSRDLVHAFLARPGEVPKSS